MNRSKKFVIEISWKEQGGYPDTDRYESQFKPDESTVHSILVAQLFQSGSYKPNITGIKVTEQKEEATK